MLTEITWNTLWKIFETNKTWRKGRQRRQTLFNEIRFSIWHCDKEFKFIDSRDRLEPKSKLDFDLHFHPSTHRRRPAVTIFPVFHYASVLFLWLPRMDPMILRFLLELERKKKIEIHTTHCEGQWSNLTEHTK